MLPIMDDARLRQLAAKTGIPLKQIAQWHFIDGQMHHKTSGRPKAKRPAGTLSVLDIIVK
jgi:hypothetical protein